MDEIDLETYWNDPDDVDLSREDALDHMVELSVPLSECDRIEYDPFKDTPHDLTYEYYFSDGADDQPWWRSLSDVDQEELVDRIIDAVDQTPSLRDLESNQNAREQGFDVLESIANDYAYDLDRFLSLFGPAHQHARWSDELRQEAASRTGRRPLQLEQTIFFCTQSDLENTYECLDSDRLW